MPSNAETLISKLDSIAELTDEDRRALSNLPLRIRDMQRDEIAVRDGEAPRECCVVIEGFMHCYKILPDGKRQILAIHIPGDVPDLQSLGLGIMDHGVAALVRCKAGFIPHESLRSVMRTSPGIGEALWRATLIDAAIFRAWIVGMGQRSAHGQLAHHLCEMFTRLRSVGLAPDDTCDLPMTQEELGDVLGLSTVHVNRTLMELRGERLVEVQNGRLTILNWKGLAKAAQFDPTYLHLRKPARAA